MFHQELYHKIFAEKTGSDNPKDLLQNTCNEYPYFSLAHFFLLKETPAADFNYRKIAAKTALHFNNPFLLRYQLNRKTRIEEVEKVEVLDEVDKVEQVERVDEVEEVERVDKVEPVEGVRAETYNMEKADVRMENVEITAANTLEKESITELAAKPVEKVELLFEPLHTTDYFASQGIKLSEEVQTGDKLGKQLKSFTDWLKTMKKVHHGKLPEAGANVDLAVQNLAEKSNKEDEILTESMAEVYVQQGKKGKARDIYQKLSLLNPAKSAYFAAKIEFLKEN